MNKVDSIVIVHNKFGSVATMHFTDSKTDKIISATAKPVIYKLIEEYVKEVTQ